MMLLSWISKLFREAALRGIKEAVEELGIEHDPSDPLGPLRQHMLAAGPAPIDDAQPETNGRARSKTKA